MRPRVVGADLEEHVRDPAPRSLREQGYGNRDFSVLVALRAAESGAPLNNVDLDGAKESE